MVGIPLVVVTSKFTIRIGPKLLSALTNTFIRSIPEALAVTERVCSSVNVGSTKTGIDMDAVRLMGEIVKETAERSEFGPAKLVVFCNAPDDNPFMAGAFHGVTEGDAVLILKSTIAPAGVG